MEKINFLPTKFQYDYFKKEIVMWYRKENDTSLYRIETPFNHYIYVDENYNSKNMDISFPYKHLTSNKTLYKMECTTKEARNIIESNMFCTGEGDVSPVQRFICDTFAEVEYPSINPRIFFIDIETTSTKDKKFPSFKNNSAEINAITLYDNYNKRYYVWGVVPNTIKKDFISIEEKITNMVKDYDIDTVMYSFSNFKSLIKNFSDFLIKNIPDIITTWNTAFDIPYIVRKIYDYFGIEGLKRISPFNTVSSKVTMALEKEEDVKLDTLIPGIDVLDLLTLYKKYGDVQKESYKLNDVAKSEIGETKIGYEMSDDGNNLFDLYYDDYETFIKYNIQDVRLIVLLEEKCRLLKLACAIRNYVKTDYSQILHETITIDNLFVMEAVRRRSKGWNFILPTKQKNVKQKYTGAYVKPPIVGLFKWLGDCDYTSLYPSITKTFKISNETLVGEITNEQVVTLINIARFYKNENRDLEYIMNELFPIYRYPDHNVIQYVYNHYGTDLSTLGNDLTITVKGYETLYENENYPYSFNGIEEFNNFLKEHNFALLPNGVIIDQNKDDAIISKVIADVMIKRTEYKNIMKDLLKQSNKAKDEGNIKLAEEKKEDSAVYDMNQKAIKVINNGIYGATANENFRLFNLKTAEAITTTGQVIIRSTRYLANILLNKMGNTIDKDYVITIDTDSIIFTLNGIINYDVTERRPEALADIALTAKEVQKYVNINIVKIAKEILHKTNINDDNNYLNIKNEWLADSGLFLAKKRYVIHQVYKEGIPFEKLAPTGIDIKRSTTPKVLKPFLENVIIKILSFDDKKEIDKMIIEESTKLKRDYTLQEIAIPCGIKDIEEYQKNIPIHVRGAKIWNDYYAENDMDKIVTGKIKYIYVSKWDKPELNRNNEYVISLTNDKNKWDMISQKITVDWHKMKDRLIIQPVVRFYDAMNWEMPMEVMTDNNCVLAMFKF